MSEVTKRQVPGDVFFEGLSEINEGALLEALDTKMTSLVSAVLATGNNGSLTLKLSVKRKGGVNQVVIEPKVTASIPDPTIAPRIMFADTSGALHTDDPAQGKLDLDAPVKVTFPAVRGAEGDTTYEIKVRLRVRLTDGKLYFVYQLIRADIPERNAIKDIADKLAKDLPENRIYRGAVCRCTKSAFTGEIDR